MTAITVARDCGHCWKTRRANSLIHENNKGRHSMVVTLLTLATGDANHQLA